MRGSFIFAVLILFLTICVQPCRSTKPFGCPTTGKRKPCFRLYWPAQPGRTQPGTRVGGIWLPVSRYEVLNWKSNGNINWYQSTSMHLWQSLVHKQACILQSGCSMSEYLSLYMLAWSGNTVWSLTAESKCFKVWWKDEFQWCSKQWIDWEI